MSDGTTKKLMVCCSSYVVKCCRDNGFVNIDGFGEITVSKVGYIPGQTTFITPLYCDR